MYLPGTLTPSRSNRAKKLLVVNFKAAPVWYRWFVTLRVQLVSLSWVLIVEVVN